MKSLSVILLLGGAVLAAACSNSSDPQVNNALNITGTPIPLSSPLPIAGTEANVVPVTVGCGYINEPCVTVTICTPGGAAGSSSCVTVPNVLLDTGSHGLRLFASAVPLSLSPQLDPVSKNPVAECVGYLDGSSDWGSVVTADVLLGNGNERAANVPVQLIDASYGKIPASCTDPDTNPAADGYNGIMGVGLFTQDCGDGCVSDTQNNQYFACPSGAVCNGIALPLSQQVSNPVMYLQTDNNGVILQLANVAPTGVTSASGYLILGIGTQADNTPPAGVTVFTADGYGNFQTFFGGQLYTEAFLDSGSNATYFPEPWITPCSQSSPNYGFFCGNDANLQGVQIGASGSPDDLLSFQVSDADTMVSGVKASSGLGGSASGYFDWGLPFFFGKTIYVGTYGGNSRLGSGPYWGF